MILMERPGTPPPLLPFQEKDTGGNDDDGGSMWVAVAAGILLAIGVAQIWARLQQTLIQKQNSRP